MNIINQLTVKYYPMMMESKSSNRSFLWNSTTFNLAINSHIYIIKLNVLFPPNDISLFTSIDKINTINTT